MSRFLAALGFAAISPLAAASGPQDVVSRFYDAVQGYEAAPAAAPPMLGDALRTAMDAQSRYELACSRLAAPDEKPHMLDQGAYLWAPDRPESIKVGAVKMAASAAWVEVEMRVGGHHWTDRVLLQQQSGNWRVMDIRWGEGGNLVGRLKAFSAYRCTT